MIAPSGPRPKSGTRTQTPRTGATAAPAPPPSYSGISDMPDYVTALTSGCFSEQAIASITSLGFDANRAACTATVPIGGRLQKAKETWHLVTDSPFILNTVMHGFLIRWDDGLPNVPHDGKNPPATEDSKIILDKVMTNMLSVIT